MQNEKVQPVDEVKLKDGRKGVLYALTQNNRNPLGSDRSRPGNWYFSKAILGRMAWRLSANRVQYPYWI